jgi:hypothetical protein
MKIFFIISFLSLSILMSSCETIKYLSLTDGSKSDGTLKFSYDVNGFEKPVVQWDEAIANASERCKAWGYTGAEWLGDGTKTCIAYNQYGCISWRYTYLCQCTGELLSEQIIIHQDQKSEPELTTKEKAIKELKQAKELLDMGIITQDEYDKKAAQLKLIILGD